MQDFFDRWKQQREFTSDESGVAVDRIDYWLTSIYRTQMIYSRRRERQTDRQTEHQCLSLTGRGSLNITNASWKWLCKWRCFSQMKSEMSRYHRRCCNWIKHCGWIQWADRESLRKIDFRGEIKEMERSLENKVRARGKISLLNGKPLKVSLSKREEFFSMAFATSGQKHTVLYTKRSANTPQERRLAVRLQKALFY